MVYLFRLLLLVVLITPFHVGSAVNAAETEEIRLLREFGEEETVLQAVKYHGEVYFFVLGDNAISLWKTGGDSQNTVLVKRIEGESAWSENIITHRNSTSLPPEKKGEPILINDNFYFFSRVNASGAAYLWQSNGTPEGTTRVAQLPEFSYGMDDAYLMNGILYFLDPSCLWRTDGTSAGTWQVSAEFDRAESPAIYNNHLYFSAADEVHDQELWISDGTPAGTRLFADLNLIEDSICPPDDAGAGPNVASSAGCSSSSFPENYAISGNELYFTAFSPLIGVELWKTNGNGVRLVKDFHPGNNPYTAHPSPFTLPDGTLLICADDGEHGSELWTSDGTTTGTTLLKDIFPGAGHGVSCGYYLGTMGNALFFPGNDGGHGGSLWKTDGTAAGTVPVKHFPNSYVTHSPFDNAVMDGKLYFDVSRQFWATDGSAAGTTMLAENIFSFFVGGYDPPGVNSAIFNHRLILSAGDHSDPDLEDIELWATDGTRAGTKLLRDLLPGTHKDYGGEISSVPKFFFPMDKSLLFFAGSSIYYKDDLYLRSRTGLFSMSMRPITLPWLKTLLLNDR